MEGVAAYLIPFIAFVALWVVLYQRAKRHSAQGRGRDPQPLWPSQARWLLFIIACAAAAALVDAFR
jgi:hypothetical protein